MVKQNYSKQKQPLNCKRSLCVCLRDSTSSTSIAKRGRNKEEKDVFIKTRGTRGGGGGKFFFFFPLFFFFGFLFSPLLKGSFGM